MRYTHSILGLLIFTFVMMGCGEEVVVSSPGKAVTAGGVEFTVGDYEVRYLEINAGDDTYEYPRPVLVLPISLKNVGEGSFIYSPSHSSQQMSESSSPLLYLAPGPEADLPPESKTHINGVYLEKGSPEGQVTTATTLNKGESVNDIFLFEVPDAANDLVLSLPPSMHRGKMPVLFKFGFEPREAKGPKVFAAGEAIDFDGVSFNVTGASTEYVKISDVSQGEGFSSEPLFKVAYEITNNTEKTVEYEPSHNAVGTRGAALFDQKNSYKRVKFSASTTVDEQQRSTVKIEPGESVKDFVLFELPDEDISVVSVEYPAALFGRTGLARVTVDYTYEKPDKPKELQKKKDD